MCFQEFQKCTRENHKTRIWFFFLFPRGKFNRSKKQNNITNTQANTVDASSLVEFVFLIASLVLLLAEAYQSAPFISARIKPLLWLLGTHWGGLEMGREGRGGTSKQRSQGKGSQNWRWWVRGRWNICAFKGKWERKKAEFGRELPTAFVRVIRVCVCVWKYFCTQPHEYNIFLIQPGELWWSDNHYKKMTPNMACLTNTQPNRKLHMQVSMVSHTELCR